MTETRPPSALILVSAASICRADDGIILLLVLVAQSVPAGDNWKASTEGKSNSRKGQSRRINSGSSILGVVGDVGGDDITRRSAKYSVVLLVVAAGAAGGGNVRSGRGGITVATTIISKITSKRFNTNKISKWHMLRDILRFSKHSKLSNNLNMRRWRQNIKIIRQVCKEIGEVRAHIKKLKTKSMCL